MQVNGNLPQITTGKAPADSKAIDKGDNGGFLMFLFGGAQNQGGKSMRAEEEKPAGQQAAGMLIPVPLPGVDFQLDGGGQAGEGRDLSLRQLFGEIKMLLAGMQDGLPADAAKILKDIQNRLEAQLARADVQSRPNPELAAQLKELVQILQAGQRDELLPKLTAFQSRLEQFFSEQLENHRLVKLDTAGAGTGRPGEAVPLPETLGKSRPAAAGEEMDPVLSKVGKNEQPGDINKQGAVLKAVKTENRPNGGQLMKDISAKQVEQPADNRQQSDRAGVNSAVETRAAANTAPTGESSQNRTVQNFTAHVIPGGTPAPGAKPDGDVQVSQLGSRLAELVKEMSVKQQPNQTSIRLKLEPKHLGEITVHLSCNRGEVSARFYAATIQAKEALEASMPQIRDALFQQQVRLSEASVFWGQGSGQWERQQQQNRSRGRGGSGGLYRDRAVEVIQETAGAGSESKTGADGLNLLV
ncbi:flagellar hook-length control protein FliK [Desulfohalotomaculum tongense]|uniref:flagellar hook-length control protein FliK n=1 Tax=Desulforadius tongensis TaxID=1216062 RepID=UPI00195C9EC1|nr:flagellar hook-length control protein FliK [Desulforadius tongensis]